MLVTDRTEGASSALAGDGAHARPVRDLWAQVDHSPDGAQMVRLLEHRGAQAGQVELRRRFWEWIAVCSGATILEVGCGTGVWTREAAGMVGPRGRALGVDSSQLMVKEARRLALERGGPLHLAFAAGDGAALPFLDGTWDLAITATVLGHASDKAGLMREMARIVRPSGRVAVFEQDQETFVVNHSDRLLTRKILNAFCDSRQTDGWSGRKIFGMMRGSGLREVLCLPMAWVDTDYCPYMRNTLQNRAWGAVEVGAVTEEEAEAWLGELEGRVREGTYFGGITYYGFVGTR